MHEINLLRFFLCIFLESRSLILCRRCDKCRLYTASNETRRYSRNMKRQRRFLDAFYAKKM